jgi:hypothetical protein
VRRCAGAKRVQRESSGKGGLRSCGPSGSERIVWRSKLYKTERRSERDCESKIAISHDEMPRTDQQACRHC